MSSSFVRIRAVLRYTALAAALSTAAVPLAAQETGTIRGKVVEAGSQRPLNGVQVVVDGTTRGALTNAAGEYTLANVPEGAHTVRASMVGFGTVAQTITVTASKPGTLDFTLAQSAISLDALVVTGTPGATQKRALGNSITQLDAAAVTEQVPINTVAQLLQARTPGMTLIQPSGAAGTSTNIRIRGTGSMQAGTQPIFIIDGVRMSGGGQGGFSVSGQSTSALDAINPADIESIEVIKGPAAATLYGADAAAGVIQIITKKGKAGQQKIQWTAKVETGQEDWARDIPNRYTLCTPTRIQGASSGAVNSFPGCAGMDSLAAPEARILSGNNLKDDAAALRTGSLRNYSLSARGGGERYSFYFSGDKANNEGVFYNNYFDRLSGRANFTVRPTDVLDLQFGVTYAQTDTRLPNADNSSWSVLRNTYRAQPGRRYAYAVGYANMSPALIAAYDNVTHTDRLILNSTVKYQPTDWFKNQVTVGLDNNNRRATLFFPRDTTGKAPYGATYANGYVSQYLPQTYNWTAEYAGTITHDLSDALASSTSFGAQFNHYQFRSYQATGEGLTTDKLNLVGSAAVTRGSESFSENKSFGVYAQQQLGWKDRVFVTGTVRLDDNSTFGTDYSGAMYPNIQGSYVISDEDFFHVPGVESLKLRAAWGKAGKAPSAYQADRTYAASAVVLADGTSAPAFTPQTYGNPLLKAEEVSEVEAGFDAELLGGRAGVDLTFYNKTTNDAIVRVPVAPSSGFGLDGDDNVAGKLTNVGAINNKGLEVGLFATPVATRALSWDTRVNLALNKNRLTSWGGARDEPLIIGYRSSQVHDVGLSLASYQGIGVKYNADGTPMRTANGALILGDTVMVGPSVPTREIGFSNTLTLFGNLKLYGFLDYKGGHYQFNMTEMTAHQDGLTRPQVYQASAADSLQAEILRSGATLPFIEKADFIKLRELSLSYDVPARFTKPLHTDRLSLSLAGRNLWMWSKYSGPDPEVNINGDDTFTRADYMSVPATRQWVATVNVAF